MGDDGNATDSTTDKMTEIEVDRPGYLASSVDCVKWAADGRLAVNLGTMVFVYEPRFDGGELYHHEAYSVPCPEPDPVVLDLQCFPGKAGDIPEFARKGFKYQAAQEPGTEKAMVGGDCNSIQNIAWSALGCAWDGGCLLCVSTSFHAVTVFQPPSVGTERFEWEPCAVVSKKLLDWALVTCTSEGAKKMRILQEKERRLQGRHHPQQQQQTTTTPSPSDHAEGGVSEAALRVDDDDDDECGITLDGLWAVARISRSRITAWMDRRVRVVAGGTAAAGAGTNGAAADIGGGDSGLPHKNGWTTEVASNGAGLGRNGSSSAGDSDRRKDVREAAGSRAGSVPDVENTRGLRGEAAAAGGDEFTLLAVAGEWYLTLWAFSAGAAIPAPPEFEKDEVGHPGPALSLGFVGDRPSCACDMRAPGVLEEGDGQIRALAWCHEGPLGDSNTSLSTKPSLRHRSTTTTTSLDFLAVGTSAGSVVLFSIFADSARVPCGGTSRTGSRANSRSPPTAVAPAFSVRATPLRRLCLSEGKPVGSLTFISPSTADGRGGCRRRRWVGEGSAGQESGARLPHALAVAKGASVIIYPSATAPPPATARPGLSWLPDVPSGAPLEWHAHEHNITAMSTAAFPGPLFRPFLGAVSSFPSAVPPNNARDETSSSTATGSGGRSGSGGQGEEGAMGSAGGGGGGGGTSTCAGLLFTSSMDGSCREWEVTLPADDGGSGNGDLVPQEDGGRSKARLRKAVAGGDGQLRSPPLLGCAASPNGVLVAWIRFAPPERSSRKAVEHIRRKGTHCRLMVTPMLPPALERAATGGPADSPDCRVGAAVGGESSPLRRSPCEFTFDPGSLSTDWAWYLRAAALADASLVDSAQFESNHQDYTPGSSKPSYSSPLILPPLCRELQIAIATASSEQNNPFSLSSGSPPIPDPPANASDFDDGSSLMAMLRLHHVGVSIVKSVAEYRASLRVVPEVGCDLDENDGDFDGGEGLKLPKEEIEDDADGEQEHGQGDNETPQKPKFRRRRTGDELKAEDEAYAQAVAQARAAVAAAIRPAVTARTRLVLLRAWQQVLRARERPSASTEMSSASGGSAESEAAVGPVSTSAAAREDGRRPVVQPTVVGAFGAPETEVITRAAMFLREACRRVRGSGDDDGGGGGGGPGSRKGARANNSQESTVEEDPVLIRLLRSADVERTLFQLELFSPGTLASNRGRDRGGDDSLPVAKEADASIEKCLLCRADMVGPEGSFGRGSRGAVGNGKGVTEKPAPGQGSDVEGGISGLELPGWAVCARGHRLARCMDTLAPTLSVDFRRCEVCRSVVEVSEAVASAGGGEAGGSRRRPIRDEVLARGIVQCKRGTCVLCGILVTARGYAI